MIISVFFVSWMELSHLHRLLCVFRGMAGLDSDLDLDITPGIYLDWDFVYYL